jgi:2-polyprenyl-3-methyl-5-hydroxy-6-metoxy-1,4-benzoquinol methylase/glycosyltransferase involved in cell wall biosynthesis
VNQTYKNAYDATNMYGHVVEILDCLRPDEGVHLDIGCGYGAIVEGFQIQGLSLKYIGIDVDQDAIDYLVNAGYEAYCCEIDTDNGLGFIRKILKSRRISSITILDTLEHVCDPKALLQIVYELTLEFNAPVIISVPNVAHKDIAFKLIEGRFEYTESGLLDRTHLSFFTHERLEGMMDETGFELIHSNDFLLEESDQHFPLDSPLLCSSTTIHQYLEWLKTTIDPYASVNQFVRAYLPMRKSLLLARTEVSRPFLSVISRTQGRRLEALSEMLLCLAGQTCTDFEVLVIGHCLSIKEQIGVEKVLDDLPAWQREQTRLIRVDTGNRTLPLHVGFQEARGEYISILDDDDLVFDNWVETFKELAESNSGTVLHAYSVKQPWRTISDSGIQRLRATGSPDNVYCQDFDLLTQLSINYCPTMSYAMPRYIYQELGLRFNQSLTTTEDWDFLMRTAFLCGVSDSSNVTSIYRIWGDSPNSQTDHDQQEWELNHSIIKRTFNQTPFVLPLGYTNRVSDLVDYYRQTATVKSGVIKNDSPILYLGENGEYRESLIAKGIEQSQNTWVFEDIPITRVSSIRIDPGERGGITVQGLSIHFTTDTNKAYSFTIKDVKTNGCVYADRIAFFRADPQIFVKLTEEVFIQTAKVTYALSDTLDESLLRSALRFSKPYIFFFRIARKIKRILKM